MIALAKNITMKDHGTQEQIRCLQRENKHLKGEIDVLHMLYESVVKHSTILENELEKHLREITIISSTDSLTRIFNRKKFNECLASEIEREKRYGTGLSLIMFDIDFFKQINDNSGHDFGDRALLEISGLVGETIRETDILGRWGGDEFVILSPGTPLADAASLAERIRLKIQSHHFNSTVPTTCSFGVAKYFENDTINSLLKRADNALYEAKKNGRNCVKCNPCQ